MSARRTLSGIGAGLRCEHQGFADCLDRESDDDLVGHLGRLSIAVGANQSDVVAHQLKQRLGAPEGFFAAADHDRESRILCAVIAAGYWCVQVIGAEFANALGKGFSCKRRDRAHIDH